MGIEGSDLKAYKNTKRRIFTQENCYKYNQRCIVIRYLVLLVYWIWMCASLHSWIGGLVANLAILWRRGARTPQIPLCTRAKKEKKNNFWRRRSRSSNPCGVRSSHAAAAASPRRRRRRRRRLQKRTSRAENSTNRLLLLILFLSLFSTAPAQISSTFQTRRRRRRWRRIKPSFGGVFFFLLRLIKASISLRPRGDPGFDCSSPPPPLVRASESIHAPPARSLCEPKVDSS